MILVQLDEGVRLVSNLVDAPTTTVPYDDMPVVVDFRDDAARCSPFFRVRRGRVNGDTIVAGIGQTEFSKDSGRSELQLAAEACRAAILDAGLTPADIDGMVTFTVDGNDELELMRNLGIERDHWWSRTPGGGVGRVRHRAARGRRGDVGRGERGARVPRVQRAVAAAASASRTPRPMGRAPLDWYSTFGIDTPAKMYSLWFRRYMHAYGVTNEDFGRYTVVGPPLRGHQPERVVLRAADHARRPPGVALDRRAGAAAARLLPGERRRRRARRHARRARAPTSTQPGRASWPRPTRTMRNGSMMYELLPRRPRDVSRGGGLARQLCAHAPGSRPTDIDVAMLYENFSPLVFLPARGVRVLRAGRGEGLHRRRQHRPRRHAPRQHPRRPARRGATSTA